MEEQLQHIYDNLSQEYDLGSFEIFSQKLQDTKTRRSIYDKLLADNYDIGTFEEFEGKVVKKKEESASTVPPGSAPLTGPPVEAIEAQNALMETEPPQEEPIIPTIDTTDIHQQDVLFERSPAGIKAQAQAITLESEESVSTMLPLGDDNVLDVSDPISYAVNAGRIPNAEFQQEASERGSLPNYEFDAKAHNVLYTDLEKAKWSVSSRLADNYGNQWQETLAKFDTESKEVLSMPETTDEEKSLKAFRMQEVSKEYADLLNDPDLLSFIAFQRAQSDVVGQMKGLLDKHPEAAEKVDKAWQQQIKAEKYADIPIIGPWVSVGQSVGRGLSKGAADLLAIPRTLKATVGGEQYNWIDQVGFFGDDVLNAYNRTFPKPSKLQRGIFENVVEFEGKEVVVAGDGSVKDVFADGKRADIDADFIERFEGSEESLNPKRQFNGIGVTASKTFDALVDFAVMVAMTRGAGGPISRVASPKVTSVSATTMAAFTQTHRDAYLQALDTPGMSTKDAGAYAMIVGSIAGLINTINPLESKLAGLGARKAGTGMLDRASLRAIANGKMSMKDATKLIAKKAATNGVAESFEESMERIGEIFTQQAFNELGDAGFESPHIEDLKNEMLETVIVSFGVGALAGGGKAAKSDIPDHMRMGIHQIAKDPKAFAALADQMVEEGTLKAEEVEVMKEKAEKLSKVLETISDKEEGQQIDIIADQWRRNEVADEKPAITALAEENKEFIANIDDKIKSKIHAKEDETEIDGPQEIEDEASPQTQETPQEGQRILEQSPLQPEKELTSPEAEGDLSKPEVASDLPPEGFTEEVPPIVPPEETPPKEEEPPKLREKKRFARIEASPEISEKVRGIIAGEEQYYETVSHKDANEIADAILTVNGKKPEDVVELFEEISGDPGHPFRTDARGYMFPLMEKAAFELEMQGDFEGSAKIQTFIDEEGRKMGRNIVRLAPGSTPESRLLSVTRKMRTKKGLKLSETQDSGLTAEEEVRAIMEAYQTTKEEAATIVGSDRVRKAVEKARQPKEEGTREDIKRGKELVSKGLKDLRKKLGGQLSAGIPLDGETVQALTDIVKGLALQFRGNAAKVKDAFVNLLNGEGGDGEGLWKKLNDQVKDLTSTIESVRKETAASVLADKVVKSLDGKKSRKKDVLDRMADELGKILNEGKKPVSDNVAKIKEKVAGRKVTKEVWDKARTKVEEGFLSKIKDDSVREAIISKLDQFEENYFEAPDDSAKAEIRKSLREDFDTTVDKIISEHYTTQEETFRSLADKLIGAGMDLDQAKAIEAEVRKAWDEMLAQKKLQSLEKFFADKPKVSRPRKSELAKIADIINKGALDFEEFSDAFSAKYGFNSLTPQQKQDLKNLQGDYMSANSRQSKIVAGKKLTNYLEGLKDHSLIHEVMDGLMEAYYVGILSGMTTLSRAFIGALITSTMDKVVDTLKNPVATLAAIPHVFFSRQGVPSGITQAMAVLKTGYSDLEYMDVDPQSDKKLDRLVNTTYARMLGDATIDPSVKKSLKAGGKVLLKTFFTLPVMMYRSLIAVDAIIKHGLIEWNSYIDYYNQELAEGGRTGLFSRINARMGYHLKESLLEQSRQEAQDMKDAGQKVPAGFVNARFKELLMENRDEAVNERANQNALKSLLMNRPEGTIGIAANTLSNTLKINDGDNILQMLLKMGGRTIFPFLRVPTNFLNMGLDYFTPVGLARGIKGQRSLGKGKTYEESPEERATHFIRAAMGTIAGSFMFLSFFDWDEEEKKWGFSKNNVRITGIGSGDFNKDKTVDEAYEPLHLQFKKDQSKGWTKDNTESFRYIDNPVGFMIAPIGVMSDKILMGKVEEQDMAFALDAYILNSFQFGYQQSYNQGIKELVGLVGLANQKDVDKAREKLGRFFDRRVTAFAVPNIYKQIEQQRKALTGTADKRSDTMYENLIKNVPYVESYLTHEATDMIGLPMVREFQPAVFPAVLSKQIEEMIGQQKKDHPEWSLIHKFPEVQITAYYPPKAFKGVKLSRGQRNDLREVQKAIFLAELRKQLKKLEKIEDAGTLQKRLDRIRSKSIRESKKEFKLEQ